MSKLALGQEVKIGDERFKIVITPQKQISCLKCAIANCFFNEAFQQLKKDNHVEKCEQLIGSGHHLEKVDDAPQVASES